MGGGQQPQAAAAQLPTAAGPSQGGFGGPGPNVKGGGIAPAGGVNFGNPSPGFNLPSATSMSQFNPQMAQQGGYMGGQNPNAVPSPGFNLPQNSWSPQRFGGPEGNFPGAGSIRGGMTGGGGAMQGGGGGGGKGGM